MQRTRCVGLIGGVGVGATVYYYEQIARACEARGFALDMVMAHAETPRVLECAQANDRSGLAEYLNGFVRRLHAAGAEFIVIPSVTTHFCINELAALSPLPILNIFAPLVPTLARRNIRRATLFGTRFVIESRIFGQVDQVEFVMPQPDEISFIHQTYVEVALAGRGSKEQRRGLTALAHTILQRDQVDVIILAGTDLVVLFNQSNIDFPFIDCAAEHIEAITDFLIRGEPPNAKLNALK